MHGLMMNLPLQISSLIRHADRYHGATEIVSRLVEGGIHVYNYSEAHRRARQLAGLAHFFQPGERRNHGHDAEGRTGPAQFVGQLTHFFGRAALDRLFQLGNDLIRLLKISVEETARAFRIIQSDLTETRHINGWRHRSISGPIYFHW